MKVTTGSWHRLATVAAVSAFVACMVLPQNSVVRPLAGAVLVSALVLAAWYVSVVVRKATQHQRVAGRVRNLSTPATVAGMDVRLIAGGASPFVAGLFHPAIYCPSTLSERIAPDELWAVLRHEEHHRLKHAPARLLAIEALEAALPVPPIRNWAIGERAAIELAADRHAMDAGADRATIATALLTLAGVEMSWAAGFGAATEIRLRVLVGQEEDRPPNPGLAVAVVALLASLACVAYYLL